MRVNMLLRKFSKTDHDLYLAYLLPLSSKDLKFKGTIEKHFMYLILVICEGENIQKYAAVVYRMYNVFPYGSPKEDQFRYLVFIQDLRSPCYAEICLELLSLLDKNLDIMSHHLVSAYNKFGSLIANSNIVESNETRACQIKKPEIDRLPETDPIPQPHPQRQHTYPKSNKPECRFCVDFHFYKITLSININVRTAIRTDTRKNSVRAVNGNRTQATGEVDIRINIAKSMAY
ncbi:unnamed protein product [Hymenolepis diminuta]|uniref:Uncharacterized protein n=1 Tax=Hymenolepis diminuta TaxID=6216 RepID=A0A564Z0M7_HYMDI|nr:unnamed protein product [Hymenolepis diminuta]